MTEQEHVCATCHKQGTGCCFLGKYKTDEQFGLTLPEIEAIKEETGLPTDKFTIKDKVKPKFLKKIAKSHSIFQLIMPNGFRYRLKLKNRQCHFLGEQGCTLPTNIRPYYCRLYPFWVDEKGELAIMKSKTCLAQQDVKSYDEVFKRLGMDTENVKLLFNQLMKAAKSHGQYYLNNQTEFEKNFKK